MASATIDETKADFAEAAGKQHFERLRTALNASGLPRGTLVAINVVDGDYITGPSDLIVTEEFIKRFGPHAIGWIGVIGE